MTIPAAISGGAAAAPAPRHLAVAHLTPAFFDPRSVVGGGERYVASLAQALRAAAPHPGLRFTQAIFTCGARDETFEQGGVPVRVMRNDNIYPGAMNATAEPLWRELDGFDVVHVHQALTTFGVYSTAVAKSLRKRVVMTDLGGGDHRLMLSGRGIELADGVISISAYARELIGSWYAGPHEVMIGPVDTALFSPGAARPARPARVICVSRILPHKGIDRIVSALPRGLSLTVVGQVYHQAYHEHLRTLAAGKDVTFVHDADDARLVELYRASDLFAQGSTSRDCYGVRVAKPELMGLAPLEAMSCGLPAILSDAGSLPELVPDEAFGRLFSSDAELRGIFADILCGAWPGPGAGAAARAHVVDFCSQAAVGAQLGRFYARIMDGGGAERCGS